MTLTGVINTLRNGFGFIRPDSGESSYFFHSSDLSVTFDKLCEGQVVTFQVVASERGGFKAHRVSLLVHHELTTRSPAVVVEALQECTAELVDYLVKHPDALRDLHPGAFENLVGAIFRQEGFATERISEWNKPDGGVDIIAI